LQPAFTVEMAVKSINCYRICSTAYVRPHNGFGSTLGNGGRWNTPKCACIYSGSNRSIAQLEWVSHFLVNTADFPKLSVITYSVPEDLIIEADLSAHSDWITDDTVTKTIGDQFLTDKKYMALKVPSVMDPKEFNYIINPLHPKFSEKFNVVDDTESLVVNKRFYEIKEYVKAALSTALPARLGIEAKIAKYTAPDASVPISRIHRLGRRKR